MKKNNVSEYMVLVHGCGEPRVFHETFELANNEAIRLAEKHPNKVVSVLSVCSQVIGRVRIEQWELQ
jgi:hypothetical protein